MSADPGRMLQVVSNLLTNAIKFSPQGGRVAVALTTVDGSAALCVSDEGRGIEPEFLPHVFDRFTQQDSSTTRLFGGLGLGLAIVRHIVDLHGGTVRAESAGTGKGATFWVTLPLVAAQPSGRIAARGQPWQPVRRPASHHRVTAPTRSSGACECWSSTMTRRFARRRPRSSTCSGHPS